MGVLWFLLLLLLRWSDLSYFYGLLKGEEEDYGLKSADKLRERTLSLFFYDDYMTTEELLSLWLPLF